MSDMGQGFSGNEGIARMRSYLRPPTYLCYGGTKGIRMKRLFSSLGLSALLLIGTTGMASALDTSVAPGLFIQKSGNTTAGLVVTQHLRSKALHVKGFRTQASLAVPFATGGRYALTAELRKTVFTQSYLGAGVGVSRWDTHASAGPSYDFLGGTRLARHTYLEGRLYSPFAKNAGHAGFVGVNFFL